MLWIKLTWLVKIKDKDFIGAVPIMICLNSSWTMGLRSYGEERTQIAPSSSATISPLPKISIDRLYWSLAKNLSKQMKSGESRFSLLHRSCLYWYKKLLKIPRLIIQWYALLIIIMLFLLTGFPQKLKSENVHDTLITLLYVSPRFPQLQRHFFSIKKPRKHTKKCSCSGPQHLKVEVAD